MRFIFIIAVCVIAACSPTQGDGQEIALEPCQLAGMVDAQCGNITVPENRDEADGRAIDIHFAVVAAESSISEPDPVFMLAGGPGQAATEVYPLILGFFDQLNQNRAIVLVDQRGTGQSNPLDCSELDELPLDSDEDAVSDALEACRQALAERADLAQYTTPVAMQDLDDVRQALGYEQINLIGVSYGTRAAASYMRQFPENVRTTVLSAVTSPELILQMQAPADGQRALELLFARCEAHDACSANYPEFETTFMQVSEALGEGQEVTFEHPISGERETVTLDQDGFMQGVFNLLYSPELVSLLPLMIQEIAQTQAYGPLAAQLVAFSAALENYEGMFYAVACSEDAALIDLDEAREAQEGSQFPLFADEFVTRCQQWPTADLPDSFRQPLNSDIPTLLLSGEADPITPPQYAMQVAEGLSNSRLITLPEFGHDVLTVGCMPAVVTEFINAGALADLDTACIEEITPPPFFVSPAGPRP